MNGSNKPDVSYIMYIVVFVHSVFSLPFSCPFVFRPAKRKEELGEKSLNCCLSVFLGIEIWKMLYAFK